VDAVLLPVNPVEGVLGGFMTHTMEAARQKGIAVIGMKILGAAHFILPQLAVTPELLLRYALSSGITVAIVGCATAEEVRTLALAAAQPLLSEQEKSRLLDIFRPYAAKLAFYRGVI
jgi:aryl-alcohol dehydrogenase-like predicted oxidoreductase